MSYTIPLTIANAGCKVDESAALEEAEYIGTAAPSLLVMM